jgi:hypothetical protein
MKKKFIDFFKAIFAKISYEIEMFSQLLVVVAAGAIYGVIEAKWIPTSEGTFQAMPGILGHWSYYHLGLVGIMIVVSFALAISHIKWILTDRKKYILLMCLGSFPLSLMVEDAFWFITNKQPIKFDEWTMVFPGLGLDLGFTWIPLWYIIILIFSGSMFYVGKIYSDRGYKKYKEKMGLAKEDKKQNKHG